MLMPMCYALSDELKEQFFNNMDAFKNDYNGNIENVPGLVKSIINNQKVNIYVQGPEGDTVFSAAIDNNAMITDISEELYDEPTLDVSTTEEVVDAMIAGNLDVVEAINSKQIITDSHGVGNSIVFGAAKAGMKVYSWFT